MIWSFKLRVWRSNCDMYSTVVAMDNFWPVRCILQLRQWSTFGQSGVFYSCGTGVVIIHNTRYVVVTTYLCEHKSWALDNSSNYIYTMCILFQSILWQCEAHLFCAHFALYLKNPPSLFAACHAQTPADRTNKPYTIHVHMSWNTLGILKPTWKNNETTWKNECNKCKSI